MKAYFKPHPRTKKNSCRTLEGEKNILQSHTPRKKIHGELRGWKKNSCLYQITQPPPQKLNGWPLTSLLMLYQNTFRKPTSIKHALVFCFCKFTLTRSRKYSNVSRVTLKCSFQMKLSPGLAIKYRSQFCGRGQTQALRLRWAFCWFIWVIIISNNICLFLRLILNSSSITWKW